MLSINVGTLPRCFTQPLINIIISQLSEIRVFLRYRSSLLNPALKSPILQVIRRTLKAVATNTVFSVNPHSFRNCQIRRTLYDDGLYYS